jgi:hypothetical protein
MLAPTATLAAWRQLRADRKSRGSDHGLSDADLILLNALELMLLLLGIFGLGVIVLALGVFTLAVYR